MLSGSSNIYQTINYGQHAAKNQQTGFGEMSHAIGKASEDSYLAFNGRSIAATDKPSQGLGVGDVDTVREAGKGTNTPTPITCVGEGQSDSGGNRHSSAGTSAQDTGAQQGQNSSSTGGFQRSAPPAGGSGGGDDPERPTDYTRTSVPASFPDNGTGTNTGAIGFVPMKEIIDKIADGVRVPPQTTMQYEMLRFCTLRSFPKDNKPYISKIAAAGFYYANTDDEVVCYACARRKKNWRSDDDPMEIHKTLNPNCKFLTQNDQVNISIRKAELAIESRASTTRSASGSASGSVERTTSRQGVPLEGPSMQSVETPSIQPVQNPVENNTTLAHREKGYWKSALEQKALPQQSPPPKAAVARTPKQEADELKRENKRLKQEATCQKCGQTENNIAFLPCGHVITCESCAPRVRYCFVEDCGKYIKGTVRVYRS